MNSAVDQLKQQIVAVTAKLNEAKSLLTDPELAPLAQADLSAAQAQLEALNQSLQALEDIDHRSASSAGPVFNKISLEIRPGAGGDEAKIWGEDLMRMYTRYFLQKKYPLDDLGNSVVIVSGPNIFESLKYESGVHRVQRVPETEAQGRIHTSTASVAILPIVSQTQLEVKDEDLEWQFYRSGGKGGQNVNKVSTAVRLIHTPTGEVVTCSSERSQQQNRVIALDMLCSRLWETMEEKRLGSLDAQRKAAVGRAMRAEKIRTYNFPQNRVTDHRIKESWHNLELVLAGNLDEIISTVHRQLSAE